LNNLLLLTQWNDQVKANYENMSTRKTKQTKPPPHDPRHAAIDAALALAAECGWGAVSLERIAERSAVPLPALRELFAGPGDILAAYIRMIDRKVLEAAGPPDQSLSPRDRLFDLLMERFEQLEAQRAGLLAVLDALRCQPQQAAALLPDLGRAMAWMLEGAGIESGGVRGALRVAGLTALYLKTMQVWAGDDSADLTKTMAALDKNLSRAEGIATRL